MMTVSSSFRFFFNDPATTEIYTLSLHDALPIFRKVKWLPPWGEERISNMIAARPDWCISRQRIWGVPIVAFYRSEEHTSELQSLRHLVCRLLLEKKKNYQDCDKLTYTISRVYRK